MTIIVNGTELGNGWTIALAVIAAVVLATLAFFIIDVWRASAKTSAWIEEERRRRGGHGTTP